MARSGARSTCWRCGASGPTHVSGGALPCGHYIPEEAPAELLAEALAFFNANHKERDMSTQRIAVIAGDGIGKETMPEGLRVLDAAARKFGIDLKFDHFDFSSWDYCEKHGKMLPGRLEGPDRRP